MTDRKNKKRRRRRSGLVEVVNGLLTLLVLGIVVAGGIFFYGVSQFYAAGPVEEEATFLVERGSSLGLVASRLESQGLISNRLVFQGGGMAMRKQAALKPGEFRIPAGASMADILTLFTEGKPIEYFVTIPEGATSWQVAQRLNDPTQNLAGDAVPVPAEGSILPGRYDYFPRDSRQSVLEEMQASMQRTVDQIWAERDPDLPLESKEDLVILASIVERETGVATERPEVAGLFVNRLRAGMRLQTDPTIIYGITKGERQLEGGITASQKATETPYNTYVIDGLPPTPIANPGVEALRAAANPADTEHLYMMAVTPGNPRDGHYFASTLAEHQQNEAKYRQQERAAAGQAAE